MKIIIEHTLSNYPVNYFKLTYSNEEYVNYEDLINRIKMLSKDIPVYEGCENRDEPE